MNPIAERDWKLIRKLQKEKLAAACNMVLLEAEETVHTREGQEHESFLKLYEKVNEGNEMIALMFDDLKRSNALLKISSWRRYGLLNDEELSRFSKETQEGVLRIAS